MKSFIAAVLVAAYLVACTQALPGLRRNEDTDMVFVIPGDPMGFEMAAGDSADSDESNEAWKPPFYSDMFGSSSLDNFMTGALRRLRERMAALLSCVLNTGVGIEAKIPEGANTTSTTKIIHGHVVTINETTYMDGDSDEGTLIRVRVIDVQPQNDTILRAESGEASPEMTTLPAGGTEESTTAARSVETVEDFENELPKDQTDALTA